METNKYRIADKDLPKCPVCGERMPFTRYKGYYESFEYFMCGNIDCNLSNNSHAYKVDKAERGAFG